MSWAIQIQKKDCPWNCKLERENEEQKGMIKTLNEEATKMTQTNEAAT